MIELWQYENCSQVEVTDVHGNVFAGCVLEWEEADEEEGWEESIAVEAENGEIRIINQSQVKAVEVIER